MMVTEGAPELGPFKIIVIKIFFIIFFFKRVVIV